MKIIKQFEDREYYRLPGVKPKHKEVEPNATWFWGLGENGYLYYRFIPMSDPDQWFAYQNHADYLPMSVAQMKKIVNEFGHLLVFL
jgi:hypothetical protein